MSAFCVLGTPRSRTTWLSRFLDCEHEPSRRWLDVEDIGAYFAAGGQCVDSGLTLHWRAVLASDARVIAVERPFDEVLKSTQNLGITQVEWMLRRIYDAVEGLRAHVPVIPYGELNENLHNIYQFCTGRTCSQAHIDRWVPQVVEPDILAAIVAYLDNPIGATKLYGAPS
jgi:hypothetical protein